MSAQAELAVPLRVLNAFHNQYPGIWRLIEFERAMSITAGEKRALDIFIDATVGGRVVRRLLEAGAFQYDEEPGMLPKIFVPLAAWRVSQGIYSFEPTLLEYVAHSRFHDAVPTASLRSMPEWAPYIETPGFTFMGEAVHGFFASWYEPVWSPEKPSLKLDKPHDLKSEDTDVPPTLLFVLVVGERYTRVTFEIPTSGGYIETFLAEDVRATLRGRRTFERKAKKTVDVGSELLPFVNVLLYLCTPAADYERTMKMPTTVPTKEGPRFVPPAAPRRIVVGERLGKTLATAQKINDKADVSSTSSIRTSKWYVEYDDQDSRYVVNWHPAKAGLREVVSSKR
jgi:hypothetical protein